MESIDTFLSEFEFLWQKQDLYETIESSEKAKWTREDFDRYARECEKYFDIYLKNTNIIVLLSRAGLLSVAESNGRIDYRHIDQFELDYLMAIALKRGNISNGCRIIDNAFIDKILKLIRVYFCVEFHDLYDNNVEAEMISARYRLNKMFGWKEKHALLRELCIFYQEKYTRLTIKPLNIINFYEGVEDVLKERINDLVKEEFSNVISITHSYMLGADDIQRICREKGLDYALTKDIIDLFICEQKDLQDSSYEELYLFNPLNKRFIIKLIGDVIFLPNVSIVLENEQFLIEKIIAEYGEKELFEEAKAKFLEKKVEEISIKKFGNSAQVVANSEWDFQGKHGENDCTIIFENYALILELKSGKVNESTQKGIVKAIKRDSSKLIDASSEQAINFSKVIQNNYGKKVDFKVKGGGMNTLDLTLVNSTICASVIFEDSPLQNILLSPDDRHVPVLSLAQFKTVFDSLKEAEIVDYFIKRTLFEENDFYCADEYDFLFNYLKTGLNTSSKMYNKMAFSERIFLHVIEDIPSRKMLDRNPVFETILNNLFIEKSSRWLEKTIEILGITPVAQNQIIRDMDSESYCIVDNVRERKKAIYAEFLDYIDSDTEENIYSKLSSLQKSLEDHYFLYIGMTRDLKRSLVRLLKNGTFY